MMESTLDQVNGRFERGDLRTPFEPSQEVGLARRDHVGFGEAARDLGHDPFTSTLQALVGVLCATRGPIVEVGTSFSTTPLLRTMGVVSARPYVAIEHHAEWAKLAMYLGARVERADLYDATYVVATLNKYLDRWRRALPDRSDGVVSLGVGHPDGALREVIGALAEVRGVEFVVVHDYRTLLGFDNLSVRAWPAAYVHDALHPHALILGRSEIRMSRVICAVERLPEL